MITVVLFISKCHVSLHEVISPFQRQVSLWARLSERNMRFSSAESDANSSCSYSFAAFQPKLASVLFPSSLIAWDSFFHLFHAHSNDDE